MTDETPYYELDDDTQKLMHTVLELALMSANLQIDQKNCQSVMDIVFTTAHRFGINFEVVNQKETEQDSLIDLSDLPFDIQVSFIQPKDTE
tara:strand:+ start:2358 stop:2630 length:273 start_codon:yes stop_codon:yes gene_type:complete